MTMETSDERIRRMDAQIEKNTKAIAELIGLARQGLDQAQLLRDSVHEAVTEMKDGMTSLRAELAGYAKAAEERSKELDERMNALIHTVDDLVRDRWRRKNGGPGGPGEK